MTFTAMRVRLTTPRESFSATKLSLSEDGSQPVSPEQESNLKKE